MILAKMPDGKPEIYAAVQGEGPTIGTPVVFVRLSNCNLACSWCDTSYTWNFDDIYTGDKKPVHDTEKPVCRGSFQMELKPSKVAAEILMCNNSIAKGVVFTGGEPLLQQKEILEVINILKRGDSEWHIEIETNGTLPLDEELAEKLTQINCSPKLLSSGNDPKIKNRPLAIERLKKISETTPVAFKFVVKKDWEKDLAEIEEWRTQYDIPRKIIYLMPEGIKKVDIEEGTKVLEDIAKNTGYRVTTRLQVLVHGDKRAV